LEKVMRTRTTAGVSLEVPAATAGEALPGRPAAADAAMQAAGAGAVAMQATVTG
jgi:hypothetical protein